MSGADRCSAETPEPGGRSAPAFQPGVGVAGITLRHCCFQELWGGAVPGHMPCCPLAQPRVLTKVALLQTRLPGESSPRVQWVEGPLEKAVGPCRVRAPILRSPPCLLWGPGWARSCSPCGESGPRRRRRGWGRRWLVVEAGGGEAPRTWVWFGEPWPCFQGFSVRGRQLGMGRGGWKQSPWGGGCKQDQGSVMQVQASGDLWGHLELGSLCARHSGGSLGHPT